MERSQRRGRGVPMGMIDYSEYTPAQTRRSRERARPAATTAMIIVELMIDGSAGEHAREWYSSGLPEGICNRRDHIYDMAYALECHMECLECLPLQFNDAVDGCWDWEIMPEVIEYACHKGPDGNVIFSIELAIESLEIMYTKGDRHAPNRATKGKDTTT
jgi:hypothetical protein